MNRKRKKYFYLMLVLCSVMAGIFLFQSCKGCVNTSADINIGSSSESGSISVNIRGIPQPAAGTEYVSMTVSGIQISDAGGTGRTSFTDPKTYEVSRTNINPQPLIVKEALRPGRWRVTVASGGWTSSGEGDVGVGRSLSFDFWYNTNRVQVR